MSQNTVILDMLKRGPVTALEALSAAGCLRLAARIADLRGAGHAIETETITTKAGKRIASYKLTQRK
jgi:hypothetical protein